MTDAEELEMLRNLRRAVVELEGEDISDCPYFARYASLPGHDPKGTCGYGCHDEPCCVTGEPEFGWPLAIALAIPDRLEESS